jgi:hypothetical protein
VSEATVSVADFDHDRWEIRNAEYPESTVRALWLEDALDEHRASIGRRSSADVVLRFAVGGVSVDDEVRFVRSATETLSRLRHEARRLARRCDPVRDDLLARFAEARLMPSEMCAILGVATQTAERFAGEESQARLARVLLQRACRTVDDPDPVGTVADGSGRS